jgi:hypothetical protein
MMKKVNIRTIIASVLMLTVGFAFGASGVSALSAEGESLLSNLAAAGSLTGIEILNKTTTSAPQYSEGAQADLAAFLKKINFDYDEFKIIDLTDYVINRNGTFEKWIQNNYGTDIQIPASVKLMSSSDLVIFLMSNKFDPEFTVSTTTRYVFDDSDDETTTLAGEENSDFSEDESFSYEDITEDFSENENELKLLKGDVNSDGFITAGDARLALRASAKLITINSEQTFAADVSNDGVVTAKDARTILRYSAKLITHF